MTRLRLATLVLIAATAGCTEPRDDYPQLMPTDQLLAPPELPEAGLDPQATRAATSAEGDALRARAEALKTPVIEPETKRRMDEALAAQNEELRDLQ